MEKTLHEPRLLNCVRGHEIHAGELPSLYRDYGLSQLLPRGDGGDGLVRKVVGESGMGDSVLDRNDTGPLRDDTHVVLRRLPDRKILDPVPSVEELNIVKVIEPVVQ